jgi:transketolase
VRPADGNETAAAWLAIVESKRPASIILSRQNLPTVVKSDQAFSNLSKGGYVLKETGSDVKVVFIATGSEVQLALAAQEILAGENIASRVISMPCVEWFLEQPRSYQDSVIPKDIKNRISLEAGIGFGWRQFVGDDGTIFEINDFGLSAKPSQIFAKFNFTVEEIVKKAKAGI